MSLVLSPFEKERVHHNERFAFITVAHPLFFAVLHQLAAHHRSAGAAGAFLAFLYHCGYSGGITSLLRTLRCEIQPTCT